MEKQRKSTISNIMVILINILLVFVLVGIFSTYKVNYEQSLFQQNLNDIENVNQAAATICASSFSSMEKKIGDIKGFAVQKSLSLEELEEFVDATNQESQWNLQLIGQDATGYLLAKDETGTYPALSYENSNYKDLQSVFSKADTTKSPAVYYAGEFTDLATHMRSFGRYTYLDVKKSDGSMECYTLLLVAKTENFLDSISINSGFDQLSTVLMSKNGDYILRNTDFLSSNFFQYLGAYNDLDLDQINALRQEAQKNGNGYFEFFNGVEQDCIFAYYQIPDTDWFCVSAVPYDSFHTQGLDVRFAILLIAVLLALLILDVLWLFGMNKRLKKSMQEAYHANTAKTDFLSRMSHDIRTPINVISGMTELAKMEPLSPKVAEYLDHIQSSGKFLLGLVNDVLDMNKVESGKMQLKNAPYSHKELWGYLDAVIQPLCDEKQIIFTKKGSVTQLTGEETDLSLLDLAIQIDSLRMNQIFFNLLSNAVKFTPEKGHILFEEQVTLLEDQRAAIAFKIQDDGCGMSEAFQKEMFSSFTQEDRQQSQTRQGSGLGLAIVKKLVELMGGSIRVESKVDVGSTFFISLEVSLAQAVQADIKETMQTVDLAGKQILLCEDHPLNAQIIVKLLEVKGAQTTVAENGKLGVELFTASKEGAFDAILMDMRMPVMNGLEAAKAIRAQSDRADAARIPILALTANAYDTDVKQCLSAGMNAHLAKPVESKKLYEMLGEWIYKSNHG